MVALSLAAAGVQAAQINTVQSEEAKAEHILSELPTEPVTLYQYMNCPFCNKVRAFFDYNNIPYSIVEVNPLTKSEIKGMKKNKNGKLKVPIIGLPSGREDQMVESDAIIDEFQRLLDEKPGKASKPWFGSSKSKQTSDKGVQDMQDLRKWVNNKFVHVITVNIYRNPEEALETFQYLTTNGNFSPLMKESIKYSGAGIMYMVSQYSIKKKRNLPGDERTHLYEQAEKWVKDLEGNDFHGGSKPDLADLSVFGVIRAVEGFQTFKDMMSKNTQMSEWWSRMEKEVGGSAQVVT